MQFTTKNSPQIDLDISYANKIITEAYDIQFLGMYAESTLSWKIHIEQITIRLSTSCHS